MLGSYNSRNNTYHKPKLTIEAFHRSQELELQRLTTSQPLDPRALQRFVNTYTQDYNQQFTRPNTQKRKALFQQASEHYIKLYHAKLAKASSLADVAFLMEEFTRFFPEGDSALIHYQDNAVFKLFGSALLETLQKTVVPGNYSITTKPFRCVDAMLLQNLAKLPIAMATKPIAPTQTTAPKKKGKQKFNTVMTEKYGKTLNGYGKVIADLIENTTKFINDKPKPSPATITMTAAALSSFDIDAFETNLTSTITQNQTIQNFVSACLEKEGTLPDAADVIRLMHAIILLSSDDNRMKYLPKDKAAQLLNSIDQLKLRFPDDRSLANQLFFIKNVYGDVFPASLEQEIAPFVASFQAQSHGSYFESVIHGEIFEAVKALQAQYPGLIDPTHLDFNNPISAELGLESDVAYLDDELKVCMQIDGDKYHRYLGSGRETQRTKLRDYCFATQQWNIAKFSDSKHGVSEVTEQLLETIVIPTYEMKTRQNIQQIGQNIAHLDHAQQTLAALVEDDSAQHQVDAVKKELAEVTQTLKKQTHTGSELVRLEKAIAQIELQLQQAKVSTNEILSGEIAATQKQLMQFDMRAAEQLTMLSRVYSAAKEQQLSLPAKQAELMLTLSDLDKTIDTQASALNAIEEKLSIKNQEIANLGLQISTKQQLAKEAKFAHDNYEVNQKTATFNRQIAKENMINTKAAVDSLNIDLYRLEGDAKLIRAEATKLESALKSLRPKQAVMRKELETIDAQLFEAHSIIGTLPKTLQEPVMGSAELQLSTKLLRKIAAIESTKQDAIAQLKDYSAQIKALSQQPVTITPTTAKSTAKPHDSSSLQSTTNAFVPKSGVHSVARAMPMSMPPMPMPMMPTMPVYPVASGYPMGFHYGYGPVGYPMMPMYHPPHGYYPEFDGGYYADDQGYDGGYEDGQDDTPYFEQQPPMLTSYQSQKLPPFIQQQPSTYSTSNTPSTASCSYRN
ncbi:hypothetical protein [Candidatus Berkiella aquae]|uniref:Chromosome partition protein Smc n=1 Tax=Candidatus Berkiella aquae TaxID=295108 RepID=A0A0Q9YIL7_9GAMM|nr:hypothetical protein [Candidatus Berkiella aquae]MCS5710148.1 hypothetical protein [Candidatus Berkiella aquae]